MPNHLLGGTYKNGDLHVVVDMDDGRQVVYTGHFDMVDGAHVKLDFIVEKPGSGCLKGDKGFNSGIVHL